MGQEVQQNDPPLPRALAPWEEALIASQPVAHLATVDADGRPHVVPIVYVFDGARFITPLDAKPKRVGVQALQRVKNIAANPRVALVIDVYDDDWQELAWVQVRGTAALVAIGPDPGYAGAGIALLRQKYPQYQAMPLDDRPVIVITPDHVVSWRAAGGKRF